MTFVRIAVVNPNTTVAMTDVIAEAARGVAAAGTIIDPRTSRAGPPAIQGAADGEAALPGLFAEVEAATADGADAIVIACFDDTGLDTLRDRLAIPVVGIGQAGYVMASLLASRWSVVTTLSVSIPVLEGNIQRQGHAAACARVRASEVPVLELEHGEAPGRVADEAARAFAEDDIGALVLGCAGMTAHARPLCERFGRPVIDGVTAAVALAEVAVGLATPLGGARRR